MTGRAAVVLAVCFFALIGRGAFAEEWKSVASDHFIVYFSDNEKFAKEVLDKAEKYYRNIATDLGYPRYSEFWTWDNRVKIYIYPDRASFSRATSSPDWVEGMADYQKKQIISYAWSKGFVESLLPHEMAHLIFRDFVGFKGEIPLWLDEGVAQWAEDLKRRHVKEAARQFYDQNSFLSVEDMMRLDIRRLTQQDGIYIRSAPTKDGTRGILFLSLQNLIDTYYLQSVSLVGFLIERYGSMRFADFCRQLRDGKKLEDALRSAYPDSLKSLEEFEKRWREYLQEGS